MSKVFSFIFSLIKKEHVLLAHIKNKPAYRDPVTWYILRVDFQFSGDVSFRFYRVIMFSSEDGNFLLCFFFCKNINFKQFFLIF